jgi:hypothetical protein
MILIAWALLSGSPAEETTTPVGYIYRATRSGWCSLRVNQALLKARTTISPESVWKYDPSTERWGKLDRTRTKSKLVRPQKRQIYSGKTDDVVLPLPHDFGLFWVKWKEDGRPTGAFAFSGPMLCEDISLGPPNRGDRVATCIPFEDRALAAYVPDPRVYCR